MRMKSPPHRKFPLRLSKQLGDAAWQKSVPPLSPWGTRFRWGWFVLLFFFPGCLLVWPCKCEWFKDCIDHLHFNPAQSQSCVSDDTFYSPSVQLTFPTLKVAFSSPAPFEEAPGSLFCCREVPPHSSPCDVLYDLGENDPVADCYMVGAQ